GGLEPEGGHLVQDLPLEGDRPQHHVEGGQAVGDHDRALAVADVAVAHLSLVLLAELGERRAIQGLAQLRPDDPVFDWHLNSFPGVHGGSPSASARSMISPAWRRWCSRSNARSISAGDRRAATSTSPPPPPPQL